MAEKKRRVEIIAVVALIVVSAAVLLVRFHLTNKEAKEEALIDQLRSVRASVQLYLTLNQQFPPDLKVLTAEKYTMGGKRSLYLMGIRVDKEGYPVDAFGNRFQYDTKTGKVMSGTKGYGDW